ncbi:MAG: EAL domain-containing protein, partial [Burkholderiales bacterium]
WGRIARRHQPRQTLARGGCVGCGGLHGSYFEVQDVLALRPDIVKIAMPRTHQVMRDVEARAWLRSVMAACNAINADVVAEGIDQLEYRDSLRLWNVPYFQGYAIGMPQILMMQNDQEAGPTTEIAAVTAAKESNTKVLYRAERVA